MKKIGMFEAKTRLAEICAEVAATGEPVTLTRRGQPLVVINPARSRSRSILELRAAYLKKYGPEEAANPEADFEVPERSRELSSFEIDS